MPSMTHNHNRRGTVARAAIALSALTALTAAIPASAAPTASTPSHESLADQIYTLKEQTATLQARNQQILAALATLRTTLQAKASGIAAPTNTPPPPQAPTGPPDLKAAAAALKAPDALNLDGMPAEGDSNAPVAILEYTDFEDDDSGDFARGAFLQIEKNYVTNGKVRYVHADFTQPWHTNATMAARAARCAGDQGKFWEMRGSLFANQDALGMDAAIARAKDLGLNVDNFTQCLQGTQFSNDVISSVMTGQRFGVTVVPTFFIGSYDPKTNSMQIRKTEVGEPTYDTIKADIDAQLASAGR